MELYIENRGGIDIPLDEERIKEILKKSLSCEGKDPEEDWEISLFFVDRGEIREINRDYRKIDRATDIISFAYQEGEGAQFTPFLLGDLIVSMEIVASHAESYETTVEKELTFVLVHGILHLLGYDHMAEKERAEMRAREEVIMKELGFGDE